MVGKAHSSRAVGLVSHVPTHDYLLGYGFKLRIVLKNKFVIANANSIAVGKLLHVSNSLVIDKEATQGMHVLDKVLVFTANNSTVVA